MKKFLLQFALLSILLAANQGQAAFYTVTGTADNADSATHGGSGTAGAPFQMSSLRGAIIAANANAGADTITLPAGIYTLTRVGNDSTCLNGDLDINGSLTINGAGPATTIVQGATDAAFTGSIGDKVIGINQDGTFMNLTVNINGVTIRYGRNTVPDGDPSFAYTGGGVDIFLTGTGNFVSFTNCIITGNENVNSYGGGVNIDSGNSGLPGDPAVNTVNRGTVVFSGCTIAGNKSKEWGGGLNLFSDSHNVVVENCLITNNTTTGLGGVGAQGAGLNIRHTYNISSSVTIRGCTIANNSSASIGGGASVSAPNAAPVTIQSSTFSGNSSGTGFTGSSFGGGLWNDSTVTTLTNVTFANNHADGGPGAMGGAIFCNSSTVNMSGGSITGNTSRQGGGIAVGNTGAAMTLSKVVVGSNTATVSGGGLFISTGTLGAGFCRIVGNSAPTGNALAQTGGTTTTTNDWWGVNAPASLISGTVNFTPWLILTHIASPSTIFVPNSTTLTASFLTNSAGTAIAVGNLNTLVGLPITFNNAVRGALSGAQTTIQAAGTATATFTANAAGAGSADAVVDNQATTASITIPTGVSSINRVNLSPTNLAAVQWTVTFTNAVSGVAAGNFSLVNVGLGGVPAITSVTPVGGTPATSWTVTASTGSGTGTLGLNMANGTGVSASVVNLPFTAQAYTIDLVAPTVTCSSNITVTANGNCPPTVNYSVSVSDNLGLALATTNPASGSVFPLGTNIVTLTARDTAGNTNFCTFQVIVLPGAAPQLSIVHSGASVVVSWTNVFPCYQLQFAPVVASNNWSSYPGPFATNSGNIYVTNKAPFTNRFFRLSF